MTPKYSIYAAPRTDQGSYRYCEGKPIYRRDFESLQAMQEYWVSDILPKSRPQSGAEFELSMVIESGGNWGHHDNPRYADFPILRKTDRL